MQQRRQPRKQGGQGFPRSSWCSGLCLILALWAFVLQNGDAVAVIIKPFVDFAAVSSGLDLFRFHVLVQVFELSCDGFQASAQANNRFSRFGCAPGKAGYGHSSDTNRSAKDRGVDFNHGLGASSRLF
jgi:hypothetical protein